MGKVKEELGIRKQIKEKGICLLQNYEIDIMNFKVIN